MKLKVGNQTKKEENVVRSKGNGKIIRVYK